MIYIKSPEKIEPSSDELGMSFAYLSTVYSDCHQRYVGAAIFKTDERRQMKKQILSIGYNAPPPGDQTHACKDKCFRKTLSKSPDKICPNCQAHVGSASICLYCGKIIEDKKNNPKWLDECKATHAEERAILAVKDRDDLDNKSILFTTTYPCNLCAKKILEVKIRKFVFIEPYPMKSARVILNSSKVIQVPFSGISPKSIYRMVFGSHFERIPL